MKTFRSYKSKRPFPRPDRYDPSKDYALAIAILALLIMSMVAIGYFATSGGT